ncbi:MAG: hypothetical protein FWE61_00470 [Micrococcales bacterium]|nr:hypothetical protein [Micrococcales bacterium]
MGEERVRSLRRLVVVGALVVGAALCGTAAWASWALQATATGTAAVTSGTLDMQVSGTDGDLAGPGGTAALPGLTLADADPGAHTSAKFTVNNAGTAAFTVALTGSADGPLGPWIGTTAWYGATTSGNTCSGGTTTSPTVAAGASVDVCVVVTLGTNAPASVQGTAATVTLTLTATQVP